MLPVIQRDLNKGTISPNIPDGKNHVLKIICGAGNHSKEGATLLKNKIPQWLWEEKGFDIYVIETEGIILVRFEVVKLPH